MLARRAIHQTIILKYLDQSLSSAAVLDQSRRMIRTEQIIGRFPGHFIERFTGKVLEQLFVDRFKFKGINVKHRIGEVQQLVSEYSWQGLLALFAAA